MVEINLEVMTMLRSEIISSVKRLLETKHLYQVERIDLSKIQKMIDEAENCIEVKRAQEQARAMNSLMSPLFKMPVAREDQCLSDYSQKIHNTIKIITDADWTFLTDTCNNLISSAGGNISEKNTHFTLPTICVACSQCNSQLPAHNSGFRGQKQEIQTISWTVQKSGKDIICQTFVFPYHCQSCKKEPLVFLVHREGNKLTLAGRNHFEKIHVPRSIPKEVKVYFSDAIVAYNTGNILSGNFLLRTTIEQHMRRLVSATGKKRGDDLADEYALLLDDEFPKRYPTLKVVYDELSARIHAADGNAAQFEKSRKDIEKHFELLSHLPLKR